jgi:hypothetical protein
MTIKFAYEYCRRHIRKNKTTPIRVTSQPFYLYASVHFIFQWTTARTVILSHRPYSPATIIFVRRGKKNKNGFCHCYSHGKLVDYLYYLQTYRKCLWEANSTIKIWGSFNNVVQKSSRLEKEISFWKKLIRRA